MIGLAAVNWEVIINSPYIVPVAGCVIGMVAILCGTWGAVKRHQAHVSLKRDMVAKGYSADEIERVLKIKS